MSDRELLELAAKAAGLSLSDGSVWDDKSADYVGWNPLTDDGDALRLAVELNMDLRKHSYEGDYFIQAKHRTGWAYEPEEPDPYAATRRAIVRAAAELGRAAQ